MTDHTDIGMSTIGRTQDRWTPEPPCLPRQVAMRAFSTYDTGTRNVAQRRPGFVTP